MEETTKMPTREEAQRFIDVVQNGPFHFVDGCPIESLRRPDSFIMRLFHAYLSLLDAPKPTTAEVERAIEQAVVDITDQAAGMGYKCPSTFFMTGHIHLRLSPLLAKLAPAVCRPTQTVPSTEATAGDGGGSEAYEAQRQSFAYGNVSIDNPNVTREMVAEEAKKLAASDGGSEASDETVIEMQTRPDVRDARSDGALTGIAGVDPAVNPGGYWEPSGNPRELEASDAARKAAEEIAGILLLHFNIEVKDHGKQDMVQVILYHFSPLLAAKDKLIHEREMDAAEWELDNVTLTSERDSALAQLRTLGDAAEKLAAVLAVADGVLFGCGRVFGAGEPVPHGRDLVALQTVRDDTHARTTIALEAFRSALASLPSSQAAQAGPEAAESLKSGEACNCTHCQLRRAMIACRCSHCVRPLSPSVPSPDSRRPRPGIGR